MPGRHLSDWDLIFWASGIGLGGGLLSTIIYALMNLGTGLVWQQLPLILGAATGWPGYGWIIPGIGGLLVGLALRQWPASPGLAAVVAEVHQTGRLNYRQAPGMAIAALLSLIFGSSAGPETPLLDINGGLGSWLAQRLHLSINQARILTLCGMSAGMGVFFSSPFGGAMFVLEVPHRRGLEYFEAIIPCLVSAVLGFTVFHEITGKTIGGLFIFPAVQPLQTVDIFWAVGLGGMGAALGLLSVIILGWVDRVTRLLNQQPLLLNILGGLGIGWMAIPLPLTLFYGEHQIQTMIDQRAMLGPGFLLLTAIGKLLTMSICLKTGFRGGFIFPLLFVGAAVGLALSEWIPALPTTLAIVCTMASVTVAMVKTPVSLAIILTVISHTSLMPLIGTAILVSYLCTTRLSVIETQRSRSLGESRPDGGETA
jgi:H+/Cl- antiporter ClcA